MRKLVLNQEESQVLKRFGSIDIVRNGFEIHIEKNVDFEEDKEENVFNSRYCIYIMNDYEKVVLKD